MTNKNDMFNGLVKNAFDFFTEAVNQIEEKPKYSLTNFYTAIELFLKARLMREHWTLIVSNIKKANFNKFKNGDFHSVNIDEIVSRLENIVNEPINKTTIETFKKIGEHRNRVVHFFDNNYLLKNKDSDFNHIISEQCQGWYYLHKLLKYKWKDIFIDFSKEIDELDLEMKKIREFLRVRYEVIKPNIKKDKESGIVFIECPYCGFEAFKQEDLLGPLKKYTCLVCDGSQELLTVECPTCRKLILSRELGEGVCEYCDHKINLEYLISEFGEDLPHDEEIFRQHAYCTECEYPSKTVVPIKGKYLCLSCLTIHDYISQCEWCGSYITGDNENTYLAGCVICEGLLRWKKFY